MYLRKIQKSTFDDSSEPGSVFGILMLTFVLLAVIILTSLSNTETKYFKLLDSLNTAELVYFDFGSFELKPESYELLDKLAEEMKLDPELKVQITGHTDDIGSEDFNLELSLKEGKFGKAVFGTERL